MIAIPNHPESRALILAPNGRDAFVASALLGEAGIRSDICTDLADLAGRLGDGSCFAVVTEEAIRTPDRQSLLDYVANQPPWSDLPIIVLTHHGHSPDRNPDAAHLSEAFGNITFLERPFHPTTFVSVARTALKGRQRQYDARAHIAALHESEERLQTALIAGHLGAWELDVETMQLDASGPFRILFGQRDGTALTYQRMIDAVHPDDRIRIDRLIRGSLDSDADCSAELRVVWPDGTIRWAEIRARVAQDRRGQPTRLVGVSSDITDRKTAEATLRQANENLEERVRERTEELQRAHANVLAEIEHRQRTEDQLRQAQKMEMIGQLTGGVAHDFNNLLMAVLSNLDLLKKHAGSDIRIQRLVEGAILGAQRGASLTQRLLAFARRQDLTVEPTDLAKLVDNMTDLMERSVGPRIELRIDLPKNLPPALLDANQVELALLNLVVNARDAMPEGGIIQIAIDTKSVGSAKDLAGGTYARLSVIDSGHGMDASTLKKATEPFFSTKELGKGTGLGLSMIQGLAIQLNGALRLSSEPGFGTRAELWLPISSEAVAVDPAPVAAIPVVSGAAPLNVLVVDDDMLIAMSTVDMLEDLGHAVIQAESGARALEILQQGTRVDIMITDFSMPKMTGAELAAAARKLRPDLPILLATGYAELPAGSDLNLPRLAKPYQQSQLAAEIAGIMQPAGDSSVANRTASAPSSRP